MNIQRPMALLLSITYASTLCAPFSVKNIFSRIVPKKQEDIVTMELVCAQDVTLELHNGDGTLHIQSWNDDRMIIEAVKQGHHDELSQISIENSASLSHTTSAPGTAAQEIPDFVAMSTKKPTTTTASVNYNIMIPHHAHLRLTNGNGTITIEKVAGAITIVAETGDIKITDAQASLDVKNQSGTITISHLGVDAQQTVIAESNHGSITLTLGTNSNATVQAKTANGKITSTFPITLNPLTTKLDSTYWEQVKKEVNGTIGSSKKCGSLKAYTTKGSITFTEY